MALTLRSRRSQGAQGRHPTLLLVLGVVFPRPLLLLLLLVFSGEVNVASSFQCHCVTLNGIRVPPHCAVGAVGQGYPALLQGTAGQAAADRGASDITATRRDNPRTRAEPRSAATSADTPYPLHHYHVKRGLQGSKGVSEAGSDSGLRDEPGRAPPWRHPLPALGPIRSSGSGGRGSGSGRQECE